MLILSLLVLQVLPAAFCYDVELQGNMKVAEKYLTVLKQPSELVSLVLGYLPEKIVGKGKLPKTLETVAKPYLRSFDKVLDRIPLPEFNNQITDSPKKSQYSKMEKFVMHLQNTGIQAIKNISEEIIADLNIKQNITPILAVVTGDYTNQLQNYYGYTKKHQDKTNKDLLYLDMVETSCRMLYEEQKKLLTDIIMQEKQSHHENFKKMSKELLNRSYICKKEKMRYVCDTYQICKEYSVISDHGVEIIREIIILDDTDFLTFLKILSKIFKQNDNIIAKLTEKKDRQLIMAKLSDFTNDIVATKEFFALVRSVITERFKPVTSGSEEWKTKTKATRLLLDFFDKAFNIDGDVIAMDAANVLHAIRNWSTHKRDDIEVILENFVKFLFVKLEHNLTKNARKEIKCLITAIMRKKTEDFENLLKSGSKYLSGKDFHPDVDIMLDA